MQLLNAGDLEDTVGGEVEDLEAGEGEAHGRDGEEADVL